MPSRRSFIKSAAITATALTARSRIATALPLDGFVPVTEFGAAPDTVLRRTLVLAAIDAARAAGASYADARVGVSIYQYVSAGASTLNGPPRVQVRPISRSERVIYGVRVLVDGVWGFVSGSVPTVDEITKVARRAVAQARTNYMSLRPDVELAQEPSTGEGHWVRPVRIDPFNVPYEEQIALATAAVEAGLKVKNLESVSCGFDFMREDRTFASTDGGVFDQRFYIAQPQYGGASISVGDPADRSKSAGRGVDEVRLAGLGWEQAVDANIPEALPRLAEEARAELDAKPVDVGRYDLVLDARTLATVLGDTIGHALEFDRVLGYEADTGGTTFAMPAEEVLGKMKIGSPLLTITADRSQHGSLGSVGWDDEGVKPEEFTLVKDGIVVDYLTNRELATHLAWWYKQQGMPVRSHGCASCQGPDYIPIQNLPNIAMAPNTQDVTFDDLIADTKLGIAISGGSVGSIDQQRINGQYQGVVVREIRDGKITRHLRDTMFQFSSMQFWRSLDALGGKSSYALSGAASGKGDPYQTVPYSVGAVAARFRQVNVIDTGRTG